jgi:pimeloyl-ACP methyl ester carboxylesterase
VVAPDAAERITAELFFRPLARSPRVVARGRRSRRAPPRSSPFGSGSLAAWSWGEGPTVLLVHGWEGRARQMLSLVEPLLAEGYRVVAFDLPAHGSSSGARVTVLDMARALRAVAEAVTPVIGMHTSLRAVVAHSLGGAATALAIHQGLAVERVVLLAPAAEPAFFARRVATTLGLSGRRAEGMVRRVLRELRADEDSLDVRLLAPDFTMPALVLHDPADDDVPVAHGRGIAEAWPAGRFEAAPGVGHFRILRDEGVVRRVASFVSGTDDA